MKSRVSQTQLKREWTYEKFLTQESLVSTVLKMNYLCQRRTYPLSISLCSRKNIKTLKLLWSQEIGLAGIRSSG